MSGMFNPFVQDKITLSNYNYNNGIFFDEKKKRFADFNEMDYMTYINYNSAFRYVTK
jgi:hypothetical protein